MKNKIATILLAIFAVFGVSVFAVGCEDDSNNGTSGLTYTLSAGGDYYICTGTGNTAKRNVTIASTYNSLPVREIGDSAFYGRYYLTNITIPDSVTVIGDSAFYGCSSLTNITIPENVVALGRSAFRECIKLKSVNIPEGVTVIGEYTFRNCESLTSIEVPAHVTLIGDSAFKDCIKLSEITLPDSIISINNGAFGDTAYYRDSANWDNGVLYIGTHLVDVKPSLSSTYAIKDGTLTIADDAFSHCTNLSNLTIPDSMTLIGYEAFDGCVNLRHLEIPASVQYISAYAFDGSNLASVTVEEGNLNFKSQDGILYDKETTQIIYVPPMISGEVSVADGVSVIGEFAFYNCTGLTKLTLPSSLKTVGSAAFFGCSGLTEIDLPEGLKTINDNAFSNSGLTQLTIPASVTWIGSYTFYNCASLKQVSFVDGESWAITSSMKIGDEVSVDVTDPTSNAKLLTGTYADYIWYKS